MALGLGTIIWKEQGDGNIRSGAQTLVQWHFEGRKVRPNHRGVKWLARSTLSHTTPLLTQTPPALIYSRDTGILRSEDAQLVQEIVIARRLTV